MSFTFVSQIKVIGQFWMFRSDGVYAFHLGQYTELFTTISYADIVFFHITLRIFDKTGNLKIRETEAFSLQ
ncbi:MAG: hypothetical protein BWX77_00655 [Bacteroidetes bacterium ADurb.Bin090]|nr:MAG: hypothetical protein BWX77_00655 [Bacteroidetes bacterium ADurb.Bin090]